MYISQRSSLGDLSVQWTEYWPTAPRTVSDGTRTVSDGSLSACTVNIRVYLGQIASISKDIDLEGESVIEGFTCLAVQLAADPEAAKVVGMIDEAVDVVACLLRDPEQVCL
ncbi:hypothetical protein XANCAGTX0491_007502 [Xanthoria calcicola]